MGRTTLLKYLKKQPIKKICENKAREIFKGIVEGIAHCHSKNVVHRDIKLENVMIDSNNNVKIIDFGFSITISKDKKLSIFCGTPSYMAPEIVKRTPYSGYAADIWALGILLYTLLCGKFPFRGKTDKALFKKITSGNLKMSSVLS